MQYILLYTLQYITLFLVLQWIEQSDSYMALWAIFMLWILLFLFLLLLWPAIVGIFVVITLTTLAIYCWQNFALQSNIFADPPFEIITLVDVISTSFFTNFLRVSGIELRPRPTDMRRSRHYVIFYHTWVWGFTTGENLKISLFNLCSAQALFLWFASFSSTPRFTWPWRTWGIVKTSNIIKSGLLFPSELSGLLMMLCLFQPGPAWTPKTRPRPQRVKSSSLKQKKFPNHQKIKLVAGLSVTKRNRVNQQRKDCNLSIVLIVTVGILIKWTDEHW